MLKQLSYSTLWDGYETKEEALKARNAKAKELRKVGYKVVCSVLKNQLRPYAGLGQPDGRSTDVYMINAYIDD